MSYDKLAESVDVMAQVQRGLITQIKVTEDTANAATATATEAANAAVVSAEEAAAAAEVAAVQQVGVLRVDMLDPSQGTRLITHQDSADGAQAVSLLDLLERTVNVRTFMTKAQWDDANSGAPVLNHSQAFVKAIAAADARGLKHIWVDPVKGYYNVKEVAVPDGFGLFGYCAMPYTPFNVSGMIGFGSAIVMIAGGASCFTWGNRNSVEGIAMHGRDRSQDCFKPTGANTNNLRVRWCGMFRFNRGVGTPNYIGGAVITECNMAGNTSGISGIIDSRVVGCFINANEGAGVALLTGSNDNSFLGVKNEWNNGSNWETYLSLNNTITGGVTDRAGVHNFKIGAGSMISIGDIVVRRAGRLDVAGRNWHIESASRVSINNVINALGADDGGTGIISPLTCVFLRGAIGQLTMTNVDMTGAVNSRLTIEAGTTFDYLAIRDCPGVPDRLNRPGDMTVAATVPAASTITIPIKLNPILTYSAGVSRVTVSCRNNTSGGDIFGSASLPIQREGVGATAVPPVLEWASGSFGVTGAETISVSLVNIAADGSTADLAIKNGNVSNSFSVTAVLTRVN